jgi:hypothetical protein
MSILPYPHSKARKTILVIGDWLVDEYWVVGVQRSKTSSRVGKAHYRALQSPDSTVTSFCGAGRTAAILHRAQSSGDDNIFGIVALGVWHPDDQASLEAMLDTDAVKGRTPHQVHLSYEKGGKPRKFFNLVRDTVDGMRPSTTKVIRVYHHTGQDIDLQLRIDWEVKTPKHGWVSSKGLEAIPELDQLLKERVDAIVVKDLLKGAVTPDLIEFVNQKVKGREIPWFLSSKAYLPEWMEKVDANWIHLLEIPQAAAQDAVRQNKLDGWLTSSNEPSKKALELVNRLAQERPNALIVAVPNDQSVLTHGRWSGPEGTQGVFWTDQKPIPPSVGVPMASVCFAALIAYCLERRALDLAELVESGLSFTEEWRRFEMKRIVEPLSWDPVDEKYLDLERKPAACNLPHPPFSWSDELRRWDQAYDECGVITDGPSRRLELSRATTEVKSYVCVDPLKREVLRKLVQEVGVFKSGRGSRSCMLVAEPGSGKTLLAQLIAKDHGLHFLDFNITQLISKADILDCFDSMLTTQFENRGKQLLVFVDEVDAYLEGEPVYDAFLAPLEGGIYRRAGKTFPLEPCLWLFAGTKNPEATRDAPERNEKNEKKASDFVSRLTLKPLVMEWSDTEHYRLEHVYLGAAILRHVFPDVRDVSTHVLDVFRQLPKDKSIRDIRQFIEGFEDVKLGEVRWENVPNPWRGISFRQPENGEFMVEIVGQVAGPDVLARFSTVPIAAKAAAKAS